VDHPEILLNISAVERETGLSKDVLRVWERRYEFPRPTRDEGGERQYPADQVAKLRAIRRLMDAGLRPGKLMTHSLAELNALADERAGPRRESASPPTEREVLTVLRAHNAMALQHALTNLLMRQGLQRFVLDTAVPLVRAVGDAWMRGDLQVFEEHLFTEQLHIALRTAINAFPRPAGIPRVLLTTFPGEHHGLGLLMLEALLVPEGAQCISLGTQTPVDDIARAAAAHKVQIVAVSFSAAFPVRRGGEGLATLRRLLPPPIALWAGGEMVQRLRKSLPGVVFLPDLASAGQALKSRRADAAEATGRS
jgi:DNA-binding transcriptional MerR regulator/methylmalonyl-CoA mutase cobalamin-binding subunit